MAAKFYFLLEADTGKVYLKPFFSVSSIPLLSPKRFEVVNAVFLPAPFRMLVASDGLDRGLPINFMASFYYGLSQNNKVIFGDAVILKCSYFRPHGDLGILDGLDETEVKFMGLSLSQCFGVDLPRYVAV